MLIPSHDRGGAGILDPSTLTNDVVVRIGYLVDPSGTTPFKVLFDPQEIADYTE